MQGFGEFGEDVSHSLQESSAERTYQERRTEESNGTVRPTKVNESTGRIVLDTERNAHWREDYYKRVEDARNETQQQVRRAIAAKNMGDLNILNTKQVSEMLKCSQGTAYLQMRSGIIPSFMVGKRRYTHDYIIDIILQKGKKLVVDGYADRTLSRMVYKSEQGLKW